MMSNRKLVRSDGAGLIVALVVLIVMALGAFALLRSVTTGLLIAGNFAFREAAVLAAESGSEAAIEWLKKNIARHDVEVRVISADVADALQGVKCDIVVANPPYVPNHVELPSVVAGNEPADALFGGEGDGLEIPHRFIAAATRLLKSGGYLIIEHFELQSAAIEALLQQDYSEISHYTDLNQRPRWISARRKGE